MSFVCRCWRLYVSSCPRVLALLLLPVCWRWWWCCGVGVDVGTCVFVLVLVLVSVLVSVCRCWCVFLCVGTDACVVIDVDVCDSLHAPAFRWC